MYSICKNLVLSFKQTQAFQGILKILVSFRPSAPFILLVNQALRLRAMAEKLGSLIFLNPSKTSTYIFALLKSTMGEQNV